MNHRELRALFLAERARFAAHYPVADVGLEVASRHFLPRPAGRDAAWYEPARRRIVFARPALDRLTPEQVTGIIRHELGHACDADLDAPGAEARADAIALEVTGQFILYDRSDVQNVAAGSPVRPANLHK